MIFILQAPKLYFTDKSAQRFIINKSKMLSRRDFARITAKISEPKAAERGKSLYVLPKKDIFRLMFALKLSQYNNDRKILSIYLIYFSKKIPLCRGILAFYRYQEFMVLKKS